MKKLAVCLILSLVMCLTMAFPVSAATVNRHDLAYKFDPAIDYILSQKPVGYDYYLIFTYNDASFNNPSSVSVYVFFFNTSLVPSTSVARYVRNYNFATGVYSSLTSVTGTISYNTNTNSNLPGLRYIYGDDTVTTSPRIHLLADRSTAKLSNHDTVANGLYKDLEFEVNLGPHWSPVDTSELEELLVEADQIEDIGYTVPTWTRFDTARIAGHTLLAQPVYTQPQVEETSTELRVSMAGLTLQAVTPSPAPLGFDLGSGNISGFLAPAYPMFADYVITLRPVLIAFFAIIFSIKLIPIAFERIFGGFKR